MPNRRQFVKTVAGATAGLAGAYTLGRGRAFAQQARRQVMIGGKRIRVVDVHNHCVVPEVPAIVKGTKFEKDAANQADSQVLGPARIAQMDQQGVDVQALSINDYWWYEADRPLATDIVRAQNEGLAKWVSAHPDRFVAFASVALQFPELAAEQLEDAIKRLGLRGVTLGGHVNGESLSLPKYDPFWAKAAELNALVFMHPNGSANLLKEGALNGRGGLGNIVGNPLETTVFLSRLIFDGVFDKFPALRVCGSHGGGYLPSYLGRTEVACQRTGQNCIIKKKPSDYMRQNILADTMVFSEEGLRHLIAEMGISQIVYGTDVPFNWPVTVDLVLNASFLSNSDKEAILGGNLLRLLRVA